MAMTFHRSSHLWLAVWQKPWPPSPARAPSRTHWRSPVRPIEAIQLWQLGVVGAIQVQHLGQRALTHTAMGPDDVHRLPILASAVQRGKAKSQGTADVVVPKHWGSI